MTDAPHPGANVLRPWLRTLWNTAWPVCPLPADATAFLADDGLHLPIGQGDAADTFAAAAHAGAHAVYSRPGAEPAGLRPTSRALAGLLEDARIEWLAGRELPGLRRLWASRHTVTPDCGADAETLMARLARALADERYVDPHPWVGKGRRLCFLDDAQQVLSLRQFADVRHVASLLGNDLGQMRLPLNARTYRPAPHYRDDNRWLWVVPPPPEAALRPAADGSTSAGAEAAPSAGRSDPSSAPEATPPAGQEAARRVQHREWDRRIARARTAWVTVVEEPVAATAPIGVPKAGESVEAGLRRRLADSAAVRRAGPARTLPRQPDGDTLDLNALVRARVDMAAGSPIEPRVYRQRRRTPASADVLLMLDTSASTAAPARPPHGTLLDLSRDAVRLCGEALTHAGHRCAVHGFSSEGRAAVRVQRAKAFDDPLGDSFERRLQALHSAHSTRLGAAIRHGAWSLRQPGTRPCRVLVVVTDGEPHDIDVHEPLYLQEDARHAVFEARRTGIAVFCFSLGPQRDGVLTRIFGTLGYHPVHHAQDLPAALARAWR